MPANSVRENIIARIKVCLAHILKANDYNFDAGVNILPDLKKISEINRLPSCVVHLDEDDDHIPRTEGTNNKAVVNKYDAVVNCVLGIYVGCNTGESLSEKIEKALADLRSFIFSKTADGSKGLDLTTIPEYDDIKVLHPKPYYDDGNTKGLAVYYIKIFYQDNN